ncbi:hypothetical protein ABIF42_002881 [Bradyrhizobium diazoefficiens]
MKGIDQREPVDKGQLRVLRERSAAAAHDLHQAEAPARTLGDVFLQPLGRESDRQSFVEIDGVEAALLQAKGDEVVFRDGVGWKAADLHQPGVANER